MTSKPKFAMYWASSCGGCEIAVLNIGEKILDVDANFDVVFWPVAMDAKYKDVEALEDGASVEELCAGTAIDPWFLERIRSVVELLTNALVCRTSLHCIIIQISR